MGHPDASRLWTLVGVELLIVTVGEILDKASTAVEALFGELCSNYLSERLISHAAALDLSHFEDPALMAGLRAGLRGLIRRSLWRCIRHLHKKSKFPGIVLKNLFLKDSSAD